MEDQRRGIRWTPFFTLEDLDFADDIALLSHTRQHIQEKTDRLSMFSAQVGLKISLKKTEAMCVNVSSPSKIRVAGQDISYTDKFTYLGSMLCQDGGTGVDIQNRLNKARGAFMSLRPVWRSASYSTKTKLRIYQSCVLSTLLYGCECWRMTEHDLSKLASFHTTSLRKILENFLATENLQRPAPEANQAGGYSHDCHQEKMEMDWTCASKGQQQHSQDCNALDT
ncbi:hypothetical protein ACROYT_G032970 [Oculina patagonica]